MHLNIFFSLTFFRFFYLGFLAIKIVCHSISKCLLTKIYIFVTSTIFFFPFLIFLASSHFFSYFLVIICFSNAWLFLSWASPFDHHVMLFSLYTRQNKTRKKICECLNNRKCFIDSNRTNKIEQIDLAQRANNIQKKNIKK